jgi:hypothetical protein
MSLEWQTLRASRFGTHWLLAAFIAGCASTAESVPGGDTTAAGRAGQAGSSTATGAGGRAGSTIGGAAGDARGGSAGAGGSPAGATNAGGSGGSDAILDGGAGAGGAGAGGTGAGGTSAGGAGGSRDGGGPAPDAGQGSEGGTVNVGPKTSLIWVWLAYKTSLASIAANAKSFTHVSPALYQVNYAYTSGVTKLVNANDNYDGLSSSQMVDQVHAAGLKILPLMYGGAGNFGTDQGIESIATDNPAGTQNNFITSMVNEALAKKYDGYNLDWEVQGPGYARYGSKLISFLAAFKSALNQHQMILTIDLAGWYIRECSGSGGDGLMDIAQMGHSVDLAILEDYAGSLGNASSMCPATPPKSQNCDSDFVAQMTVMCNLPKDVVSIGLISTGSNAIAASALGAVTHFGYTNVAVWPDDAVFLNAQGMPQGTTWYSALADFMSR